MYNHMKCLKCNNDFSRRIWIDGVKRNLQHRKYCLECSPFGKHNTRKIIIKTFDSKICRRCGNVLKSNRRNFCNGCNVILWRKRMKEKLVKYKGGVCKVCGYNKCIENLTFHHLNPTNKDFDISGMSIGINKMRIEVDKCELLCRNCHGELHAGIITL